MDLPTLTSPDRLWLLLAVLPLLWWLAQPPRPRRVLATAHRHQWLAAQAKLRRRPPRFRALRWLLLSGAVVLALLAAAGPRTAPIPGPDRLVVLLDGSASTAARLGADDGQGGRDGDRGSGRDRENGAADGSRFSALLGGVRAALGAVPPHVAVEVVRLGGPMMRWSGAAARALVDVDPPAGVQPVAWDVLLDDLAAAPGTAVLTATDGQGGVPAAGALLCRGGLADNVAVASVSFTDRWPLAGLDLEVELRSACRGAVRAVVTAEGAVLQPVEAAVELPAQGAARAVLAVQRDPAGGELRVRVAAPGDALPLDDEVRVRLDALPVPRIAVLAEAEGRGELYAAAAGSALAAVVGGEVVPAEAGAAVTFLIAEGGVADLVPGSAAMATFGVRPKDLEPVVWTEPVVVDWDRTEPLLQGLDFSDLWIDSALAGALPAGRPLLLGGRGGAAPAPLAVAVAGPRATSLHFAFRLQDSNLALLPAFPQLLRRALLLAHGVRGGRTAVAGPVPAGESDLLTAAAAAAAAGAAARDRPLPPFGEPPRDLAPHALFLALVLLALRAAVR